MQPWPAVERKALRTLLAGIALALLLALAPPAHAAPPANDMFAAGEVLSGDNVSATGTTVDATKEAGEPNHGGYTGGNSIWYRWTPSADRVVEISLAGSGAYNPTLGVYTGAAVDGLTQIASSSDGSYYVARFRAVAGRTYHVAVDRSTYGSPGTIKLTLSAWAPPANDDFADAAPLSGTLDSDTITNGAATREAGEPTHASSGSDAGRSVWWTWTAPSTGGATMHLTGTDFSAVVAVYTGDSVSGLVKVATSGSASKTGRAVFRAVAGTTYKIAVDGTTYSSPSNGTVAINLSLLPPPTNDAFADAVDLGSGATATASGRNDGASAELGEPQHYSITPAKASVWYAWTAPSSGSLTLRADAGFPVVLAVYSGESVSGLTRLANQPQNYNGGPEQIRVRVVAGKTYHLVVDTTNSSAAGTFNLSLNLIENPPNDDFADAQTITGTSIDLDGTNVGATQEPGEPVHEENYYDPSVWYSWTAPSTGGATLDLAGSELDAAHAVYTGESVGALTRVASTRAISGTRSKRRWRAVAGVTYRIAIDGRQARMGTFHLALDLVPVPANDLFAAAETLAGTSSTVSGNNIGATGENGEPNSGGTAGSSVWYRWTAPSNGMLRATLSDTDFVGSVIVYTGTSVDALASKGSSRVPVTAGTVYSIAVHGGTAGRGQFTLATTFAPAPANDDFAAATALTGWPASASGSNDAATRQTGEPTHCSCSSGGSGSVWFTWTATESGPVRADYGGFYGAVLGVYTGTTVDALTLVARATDYSSGTRKVAFNATAGTTYRIALAGVYSDYYGAYNLQLSTATPPANDQFAQAAELTGSAAQAGGTTNEATRETGEPQHTTYTSSGAPSVWYRWTAPSSGKVTLDYAGSFSYAVGAVYTGDAVGALTTVVKASDYASYQSKLTFTATAGTTYRIAMSGVYDSTGTVSLKLALAVAPANDHFGDAAVMTGTTATHSGSNVNGTRETSEPSHVGWTATQSVWHRWEAPASGPVTIDTAGSGFDTLLAVYTGTGVSTLNPVASNDNGSSGTTSSVTFVATAGTVYRIAVDGKSATTGGSYSLKVVGTEPPPPTPPTPPADDPPAEDPPAEDPPAEDPPADDPPADDPPADTTTTTTTTSATGSTATRQTTTVAPTGTVTPPAPAPAPQKRAPAPRTTATSTTPFSLDAQVPAQRLSAVLKRGLSGAVACSRACKVDVKVTFTVVGRNGRAASSVRAASNSAGAGWVVRLSKAAKKRLKGARTVKAVVKITARSGSEAAVVTRRVTLRR